MKYTVALLIVALCITLGLAGKWPTIKEGSILKKILIQNVFW